MWEIRTKFPLKNVGDSHIIPREKCGRLAHNTPGKMWERRGGAHSGAFPDFRSDALLMPSLVPFGVPFPHERVVRAGQYPPASLSSSVPHRGVEYRSCKRAKITASFVPTDYSCSLQETVRNYGSYELEASPLKIT